ncbi:uncharacterized protein PHACADRAFT_196730 [Phanerochaete carnosa HHB-10118-sp]|uniref:F-box domain-containing protein n=1 Tax=Phanerochaete carnosa (strain HHB-10118-sp) TaxID=650164 RepID=K5WV63_PHACS|nr:uncharacterized protein PHACADRAFT_196730 [Phanerochaete carnosa HHB-10118-sp]EKM54297.1 hypothetical protein PHACADRAFT_196730 [Phanerochaete carnosa HHB-10118-sp]
MDTIAPSAIGSLPNEITIELLGLLPPVDMVDHRTKTLVDSTPTLQYKLQLFLSGMIAADSLGEQDILRSLTCLERRESHWKSYQLLSTELQLPHDSETFLGFSGNLMVCSGVNSLLFYQLQPGFHKDYPEHWSIGINPDDVTEISMCPRQDLVALTRKRYNAEGSNTGFTVTLSTLSTGEHHPAAVDPAILVQHATLDWSQHRISVNGDLLAVMVIGEEASRQAITELYVWDWRSSILRLNAYHISAVTVTTQTIGVTTFEFLNNYMIMVPMVGTTGNAYVRGREAALYVFDCRHRIPGRNTYHHTPHLTTFQLPKLAIGAIYRELDSVADACNTQRSSEGLSFVEDPALRMIGFQFRVLHSPSMPSACISQESFSPALDEDVLDENGEDYGYRRSRITWSHSTTFCLFVHAGTLVDLCTGRTFQQVIPWDDWAANTRLIRTLGNESFSLGGNISHKRMLIFRIRPNVGIYPPIDAFIFDFPSPPALRHAFQAMDRQATAPWQYIMEPTVLVDRSIFLSEVVTGLPYRKVPTGYWKVPGPNDGGAETHIYLSGNCLLTKKRNSPWRIKAFS